MLKALAGTRAHGKRFHKLQILRRSTTARKRWRAGVIALYFARRLVRFYHKFLIQGRTSRRVRVVRRRTLRVRRLFIRRYRVRRARWLKQEKIAGQAQKAKRAKNINQVKEKIPAKRRAHLRRTPHYIIRGRGIKNALVQRISISGVSQRRNGVRLQVRARRFLRYTRRAAVHSQVVAPCQLVGRRAALSFAALQHCRRAYRGRVSAARLARSFRIRGYS